MVPNLRANAPAGATVALTSMGVGPFGDDYLGHDMLIMVNLTDSDLARATTSVALFTASAAFLLRRRMQ